LFALTSLRSQDRRIRPRLPPILNFALSAENVVAILYIDTQNVKHFYFFASYNIKPPPPTETVPQITSDP
jgi:hypothetical protein